MASRPPKRAGAPHAGPRAKAAHENTRRSGENDEWRDRRDIQDRLENKDGYPAY